MYTLKCIWNNFYLLLLSLIMKHKSSIIFLLVLLAGAAEAQTNQLTLEQCVDYALKNNTAIKNSIIDTEIVSNNKSTLTSRALPQVDATSQLTHNINIQKIVLENGVIPAFTDPTTPSGSVIAFQLQLKNIWTSQVTASQVLFDKSLFTGLANADIYKTLALKNVERSQIDVAEMVTKAYYGVLVSQKQLDFLGNNIQRVDSLFGETQARLKNGLVRQISVDRIEVRLNNLKEERERASRLVDLNMALLRFQMNLPKEEAFTLAENLDETALNNITSDGTDFDYTRRIEYDIIKTQLVLSESETKVLKDGYYPKLNAFATTGYNPAATSFGDLGQSSRYFNYTYVGLDLRIPVFHGFEKKYKVQNKTLEERKLNNSLENLQHSIDLQLQQASINLSNSLESLKIQQRNMDLAKENVRIIQLEN